MYQAHINSEQHTNLTAGVFEIERDFGFSISIGLMRRKIYSWPDVGP